MEGACKSKSDCFDINSLDIKEIETPNCGRWTDEEHSKFLQAIQLFGKDWKKVQQYVGTRTSTQARSHAQKYFFKFERRPLLNSRDSCESISKKKKVMSLQNTPTIEQTPPIFLTAKNGSEMEFPLLDLGIGYRYRKLSCDSNSKPLKELDPLDPFASTRDDDVAKSGMSLLDEFNDEIPAFSLEDSLFLKD